MLCAQQLQLQFVSMAGVGKTQQLSKSCVLLIVLAGVERFAFKGVASNLVTYLTDVAKMSNSAAAKTVNSWCGFTSLMPLLAAPIADSCSWDRYSTILTSSFIYVLGLAAVTSTAFANTWSAPSGASSSPFLLWSLCLISLGLGVYNPSLQAFGADQLDKDDDVLPCIKGDHKSKRESMFFQYWYVGVCVGSLLGVTVLSYIQDTFDWVLGFMIPTIAMATSAVFFSCGNRFFTCQPDGSFESRPLYNIITALKATTKRLITSKITLPEDKADVVELELQEKPLCCQKLDDCEDVDEHPSRGKQLVENVKIVLHLLPIWTMLLMFAVIFQQPATFFTKQGMTMKRNIGKFIIPPATLQSAITLSIILLMPLYGKILIPAARIITRKDKGISVMQRMGIGMFLSIIAMIIAAFVEMKRLEINRKMNPLEHEQEPKIDPLSIFWLLPQYILLGISDIFTVVGMQEFFYNEVPVRMRTMGFALYTSVFGAGSFLSALLIYVIDMLSSGGSRSWFSDDMKEARLDKYYWLLSILSSLSLLLYLILCRCFKSRTDLENGNCK